MEDRMTNIDKLIMQAQQAFETYKKVSLRERAVLMEQIAVSLEKRSALLIDAAGKETNLSAKRLATELNRTIFQLRSYGAYCESGEWMDIRIDTGDKERVPPKPDLRKMLIPLGVVAVFGAANFPFAYSTAGGDTACALAAGCSVVVKAHPGHLQTGIHVAEAIQEALEMCNLPKAVFTHITDTSLEAGEQLVKHPLIKAVGFTGSFKGGKQLFDWGNQRETPIPVFAEMSSVNPVFIFPEKLKNDTAAVASMLAASITLDVGQFCTNPGIMVAVDSPALDEFINQLIEGLEKVVPSKMLNEGIEKNYKTAKERALAQPATNVLFTKDGADEEAVTLATVTAQRFLESDTLQQEVFGPYSILVRCADEAEMNKVAQHLKGQLTATIIAEENEVVQNTLLVDSIKNIGGRIIMNGVPTGVEVVLSMQHGGPYPSTTDSRFTSVGADGIKRFARPQSFQNWPDALLPDELKNDNPLNIWRTVDNVVRKF